MNRVTLLDEDQAPLLARHHYDSGYPGPITASLAHVPELLEVASPFIGRALGGSTLDARTRELAIVRASALLDCEYCTLTHAAIALDAGVTADEVEVLRRTSEAGLADTFSEEREAAVLAWVDAVALGPGGVPDEVADRIRGWCPEAQVVELTMLVACTVMLNRYCTALRLPVSDSSLARLAEASTA